MRIQSRKRKLIAEKEEKKKSNIEEGKGSIKGRTEEKNMRTKRGREKEKRRREWNMRRRRTNLQRVEFRGKVEDEEKKQIRKV